MNTETHFAILFADIEGSSNLYKQVGDKLAKARIFACISTMARIIEQHHGTVIKTIGDEIMARFNTAEDAVHAARNIHQELESGERKASGEVSVKIGVNFGPAILDSNDVFGDAVNDAARMVQIAKGKQIVIPESTVLTLPFDMKMYVTPFDTVKIKAGLAPIQLYLVDWQEGGQVDDNATMISFEQSDSSVENEEILYLRYQGQHLQVKSSQPNFVVGRDPRSSTLAVNSRFASRKHFWIEFRRGKWVLVDHSTNGTWVKTQDGNAVLIRREELPLWGEGDIRLGENFDGATEHEIHFVAE